MSATIEAVGKTETVPLFRIFLSSPGDVADERAQALRLIEELPKKAALRGHVGLESISWDDPAAPVAMVATETPQQSLNNRRKRPACCDIVVVILWSRIGTPLPENFKKPGGGTYLSGTEWEFEDAVQSPWHPIVLLYRCTREPMVGMRDPQKKEKEEQFARVEGFFSRFRSTSGALEGGCNEYDTPSAFKELLGKHLEETILELLEQGKGPIAGEMSPLGTTTAEPEWKEHPYPGLLPFKKEWEAIFFGRELEADVIVERLHKPQSRFLAVVGGSGTGKSSLVHAGVLPRLEAAYGWQVVTCRPGFLGPDPFIALANCLDLKSGESAYDIAQEIVHPDVLLQRLTAGLAPNYAKVLFVDQLEELFTRCSEDHRRPFAEALAAAARDSRLRVLATLRTDYLDAATQVGPLGILLRDGTWTLGPPSLEDLEKMIRGPAELVGIDLDPALVSAILSDAGSLSNVGSSPGSLPLVAFCLERLYEENRGKALRAAEYNTIGKLKGAIGRHSEAVMQGLKEKHGQIAVDSLSSLFVALVGISAIGIPTRLQIQKQVLLEKDECRALLDDKIGLVEKRLLYASGSEADAWIELAHEALFDAWPSLKDWIVEQQKSIEKLSQAMELLPTDPLASAKLALKVFEGNVGKDPRDKARNTLHRAVQAIRTSRLVQVFEFDDVVHAVALSPDGWWLATAGADEIVRIWALKTGQNDVCENKVTAYDLLYSLKFDCKVYGVAFSPDSRFFAVADDEGKANIRRLANGECINVCSGHEKRVNSVVFSSDGQYILTSSDDKTARSWDVNTGAQKQIFYDPSTEVHNDKVNWAAFSPDGKRVATASWDEKTIIWDARTGRPLLFLGGHSYVVNGVDFSPYGGRLATAGWDGMVKVWDSESGAEITTFSSTSGGFTRVAFGQTGKRLAAAGQDWKIRVWEVLSARELFTLSGHKGVIDGLALDFRSDIQELASASWDKTVRLWNVAPHGHLGSITSVAISEDEEQVATVGQDGTARIWNLGARADERSFSCGMGSLLSAAFSRDRKRLFVAGCDGLDIKWMELAIGADPVHPTPVHPTTSFSPGGPTRAALFSSDGTQLLTIGYDSGMAKARLWSRESEKCSEACVEGEIRELSFTSDGKRLAIATANQVVRIKNLGRLWEERGTCNIEFEPDIETGHKGLLKGLAFSKDGRRLATASLDGTAKVWDVDLNGGHFGEQIGKDFEYMDVEKISCPVDEVALTPDGKKLAATGFDGTLKVWDVDVDSRQAIFGYSDKLLRLSGVFFSPLGNYLVVTMRSGNLQFYELDDGQLARSARTLFTSVPRPIDVSDVVPLVRPEQRIALAE